MGTYSISDLSQLTGVKTHTLRIWEKRYSLLKPERTDTNIRFYNDDDLKMLRLVQRLLAQGLRISTIAGLTVEQMEEECKRITIKPELYEEKLTQGLLAIDVPIMDSVLESSIRHHDFDATLLHVVLPFLHKIENMWLSGKIDESHEACFKELVKRKTMREIDTIPQNCAGPKVIMFLPKGNQQELDHHFMHYFLRKQGLCVTDVGCDINIECATSAIKNCIAECVLVVNSDHAHWQFSSFVKELTCHTSLPIIISGSASDDQLQDMDDQVIVLNDLDDTLRFVSRLKENLQHHVN